MNFAGTVSSSSYRTLNNAYNCSNTTIEHYDFNAKTVPFGIRQTIHSATPSGYQGKDTGNSYVSRQHSLNNNLNPNNFNPRNFPVPYNSGHGHGIGDDSNSWRYRFFNMYPYYNPGYSYYPISGIPPVPTMPYFWNSIWNSLDNYPEYPSLTDIKMMKDFIFNIPNFVPCNESCRSFFKLYISEQVQNLDTYCQNKTSLFTFFRTLQQQFYLKFSRDLDYNRYPIYY